MFGAIALEFELKFACFLEIFILNKAVSKLQVTHNFWWYSKRRDIPNTRQTILRKKLLKYFYFSKKRKQREVAGHISILVFLSGFFVKDIPEAANKRCFPK